MLHSTAGLNTFLAVPIGAASGTPLGVLVLASSKAKAYMEEW